MFARIFSTARGLLSTTPGSEKDVDFQAPENNPNTS
jgi:hypothetical protein